VRKYLNGGVVESRYRTRIGGTKLDGSAPQARRQAQGEQKPRRGANSGATSVRYSMILGFWATRALMTALPRSLADGYEKNAEPEVDIKDSHSLDKIFP